MKGLFEPSISCSVGVGKRQGKWVMEAVPVTRCHTEHGWAHRAQGLFGWLLERLFCCSRMVLAAGSPVLSCHSEAERIRCKEKRGCTEQQALSLNLCFSTASVTAHFQKQRRKGLLNGEENWSLVAYCWDTNNTVRRAAYSGLWRGW